MSDTILSGDFTVYYGSENNQKRIAWTGSSTGTRTLNAFYSALQNLFDDPAQMDDLVPMKADTPDIYRMQNQWFIDDTSVEHLTGGSLFSDKWKDGTTEHILMIGYGQTTEFNAVDIGRTIRASTSLDTGTILDFNTTRKLVWIRPDDPLTGGDEFDNGNESYTIGAGANGDSATVVWRVTAVGPVFVDETTDFNSATANDVDPFPLAEAVGDYFAIGYSLKYSKLSINTGTAGVAGVVAWEYWNGSAWAALAGVTDGTTNLTTAGLQNLTYTVPSDWATTSLNSSAQLYYLRARVTTVYTTNPIVTQGFIAGVGAGAFANHNRIGVASKAGESSWTGITTIGTIEANTHIYIAHEDPDRIAIESLVTATKGTSDWWSDGQLNLLLKVKESDIVIGQLPNSSPATAVATVFARQYTKNYSHFIGTGLATAGGNTVVPLSTSDDLDNTLGYRNLVWDNGSTETLVDEELLYNVGTTIAGNLDAGVAEAPPSTFTNDTTDVNDVGGAGDVAVFPNVVNDAFYFGKDNLFTLLMVDIFTQGVSTASATIWEYATSSTAWATLTVTDDSNSGNGAFTAAAGRRLISWTAPSDWVRRNITNQPAAAPTNLYYVRVRVTAANYTTVPLLETAWVGGEVQLKARVADTTITTASGATGNTDYYLIGDPITDFVDNDVVIAATSRKKIDINTAPTNVGPASAADANITATHGLILVDVDELGGTDPYCIDINNTTNLTVARIYERFKYLTRRGETATTSTNGQAGHFYIGPELHIKYNSQASGNFSEGRRVYDQTTDAVGIIISDQDAGTTGDLILRSVRGTFTNTNQLSDSPDPTYVMNTSSFCFSVDISPLAIVNESADALSAATADVTIFPATEAIGDYFAVGATKPFAKVIFVNTGGTAGVGGVALWEYWNGTSWTNLETVPNFSDGTTDFTAAVGTQNLSFSPPADWQTSGLSDGIVNSQTLYFIRARVTTVYTTNPIYDTVAVEDFVTATINGVPRAIAPISSAPFGTFPGASKLFFAPGAAPAPGEMATGQSQSYQTIDNNNTTRKPPNKQDMTVTNLVSGDSVSVLRRTGTTINKTQFTLATGNNQGNTTLVVSTTIPTDNPNTAASKVRVISTSGAEHRYRYASYATATFTLQAAKAATADASSTLTVINWAAGGFTTAPGVEVGDVVRNTTDGKTSIISVVNSNTQITVTDNGTTWSSKAFNINTLVESYPSTQNAYVPIIELIADATSETNNLVYTSDITVRVDVRKAGTILPFTQDSTFVSTGLSIAAIRTADAIFT